MWDANSHRRSQKHWQRPSLSSHNQSFEGQNMMHLTASAGGGNRRQQDCYLFCKPGAMNHALGGEGGRGKEVGYLFCKPGADAAVGVAVSTCAMGEDDHGVGLLSWSQRYILHHHRVSCSTLHTVEAEQVGAALLCPWGHAEGWTGPSTLHASHGVAGGHIE